MMKDINLQEFCKELHIYEFGIAPWPLPENAKPFCTKPIPVHLQLQMWRNDY